jgi:hypothetical protein
LIPSQTGNSGKYLTTNGTTTSWATVSSGSGTVTSVATAGTVNGITLTGGPITSSGTVTLGGTLDLSSPPAIGGTAAAAGTFTTLTATSTGTFGGDATAPALVAVASAGNTRWLSVTGSSAGNVLLNIAGAGNGNLVLIPRGTGAINFATAASATNVQMSVTNTASAVNYAQVTGNATGSGPIISAQGSDASVDLLFSTKGTAGSHVFRTNSTTRQFQINHVTTAVNYATISGNVAGSAPVFSVAGTDADIDFALTPKGAGTVRFGTYTGTILTPTGYITIKDSGGTTRRLLVG